MADEEEFLINTREKRANAGNRLKQLLELEELQKEELAANYATEDDENVNLLFQEDGEDAEYSEEESSEAEDGEGSEGDLDQLPGSDEEDAIRITPKKRKIDAVSDNDEGLEVDGDDVFTDSDDDSEESDAEEGEKELQRSEKQTRRAKAKKLKANIIPKIKAHPIRAPREKPHTLVEASSLLDTNRRASSRKAAVNNKMAVVEKLKLAEERRKANKPKERVEKYEMTQEERLIEAIETEKRNILSLSRFKEQELSKKERQRALLASRRKKLVNVIREVSFAQYISPIDEIKEEKELQKWLESRKEKRGRKKRTAESVKIPTQKQQDEDVSDPLTRESLHTNQSNDEVESDPVDHNPPKSSENVEVSGHTSVSTEGVKLNDGASRELITADDTNESAIKVTDNQVNKEAEGLTHSHEGLIQETFKSVDVDVDVDAEVDAEASSSLEKARQAETKDEQNEADLVTDQRQEVANMPSLIAIKGEPEEVEVRSLDDQMETDSHDDPMNKESKKVTFATEDDVVLIDGNGSGNIDVKEEPSVLEEESAFEGTADAESIIVEEAAEPEDVYEGPEQLVSRNLVSFEDFDAEVSSATIKEVLLGSQSLWKAQRRSNDVEPLMRIKAESGDENLEKNLFKSFKELKKQAFKNFHNLPKFGDDLSVSNVDDEEADLEVIQEIKITTPAPVGIYLSNGMKKKCLISGKESQYFDPKNGLPYGSVEAYRVLQQVQNGEFSWCQFSSTGGVYLNERNLKPAAGCPEGF